MPNRRDEMLGSLNSEPERSFVDPEQVLDAKAMARMLACSQAYARMLLRTGAVQTIFFLGARRRTKVKAVQAFIDRGGVQEALNRLQVERAPCREEPPRRPDPLPSRP